MDKIRWRPQVMVIGLAISGLVAAAMFWDQKEIATAGITALAGGMRELLSD